MIELQTNNLNVIVYIQYGIGFQLIEGQIEVEITFFNKTHKSRIIPANRNRINIYEEFLWKIDKNILQYCRTTNEMVKVECFNTPHIYYGKINRRLRIGHTMIKLNEFQIMRRDWDQCVLPINYRLYGSSTNYEFRSILIIKDAINLEECREIKKRLGFDNKQHHFTNTKRPLQINKQDSIGNNNTIMNSTKQEKINNYQQKKVKSDEEHQKNVKGKSKKEFQLQHTLNKCNDILNNINMNDGKMNNYHKPKVKAGEENQINEKRKGKNEFQLQEILNKYNDILNKINMNDERHNKSRKKEINKEIKTVNNKIEHLINESNESLNTNEYNESILRKLLTCLKLTTEEGLKIMGKITNDLDTDSLNKHSIVSISSISNSRSQSKSDSEQPYIMLGDIKSKINESTEYINKNNKSRHSQEILNLKKTYCKLSNLCDTIAWNISNTQ